MKNYFVMIFLSILIIFNLAGCSSINYEQYRYTIIRYNYLNNYETSRNSGVIYSNRDILGYDNNETTRIRREFDSIRTVIFE